MLASSMIIEGFICPECQQDMSSIDLLQQHFELVHLNKVSPKNSNTLTNSDSTNSFSLLAKAKTLISFDQSNEEQPSPNEAEKLNSTNSTTTTTLSNKFLKQYFNANQKDGYFNSHTEFFKKQRDNTIGRFVIQTNKLLITLDKLISFDLNTCNDDNKREAHYKSIVSWISDKDVQLCPNCAKGFNLINRKHHCRLCGAIMCNKCSQFISFSLAKQLTDPDSLLKAYNNRTTNQNELEFKLKRSDSITSVNSYFFKSYDQDNSKKSSIDTSQIYLRLCFNCGFILEKYYKNLKDRLIKPEFTSLYNDLHVQIIESQRLYPVYCKMAKSLNSGEAIYQLSNAEDIRDRLIKQYQKIELLSNLILKKDVEETNAPNESKEIKLKISNDQYKLQKNIRSFAINYLKENSFNLPQLPNIEEYQKLKSKRELYLIEEMKRCELEQAQIKKKTQTKNRSQLAKQTNISVDNSNGWIPTFKVNKETLEFTKEQLDSSQDEDDSKDASLTSKNDQEVKNALRIQIQLVEAYLNDALKQKKFQEAEMLQQNLNELLTNLADIN